ncbi:tryptamine hydroxycinnamoyltransferase 2 [Iris pallida]|uniref:Tryptamine hydroxycinnamoyltransferase 2 n=1 Tax=Iris pallida TaxID=29817 RepID=A0AAX6GJG1_IRIPA|nr:tryptamine hydroxycinnamoyltransferase 2 [Iris pallida]
MLLPDGEERVDPSFPLGRGDEGHDPLDRKIGRHDRARWAPSEVRLVEPEPEPAVDLEVGIQLVPPVLLVRQQGLLLPPFLLQQRSEVDGGAVVLVVHALHRLAYVADRAREPLTRQLAGGGLREGPEDQVAEVLGGHHRPHPRPPVDRHPHPGDLVVGEAPDFYGPAPEVGEEDLERGGAEADPLLELRDELPGELDDQVLDSGGGHRQRGAPAGVHLQVVELDLRGVVGDEEGVAVEEGRGAGARAARGAGAGLEELAHGLAVGDGVAEGDADDEAAAGVAAELDLEQLLGVRGDGRVEVLVEGDVLEQGVVVHAGGDLGLDEADAGVVEDEGEAVLRVPADPACYVRVGLEGHGEAGHHVLVGGHAAEGEEGGEVEVAGGLVEQVQGHGGDGVLPEVGQVRPQDAVVVDLDRHGLIEGKMIYVCIF